MDNVLLLLIPALVVWSWLRVIELARRNVEGQIISIMPLSLLARLKRHAVPIIATTIVAAGLLLLGLASPWWLLLTAVSAIGLLAMPQRYIVTTRGIRTVQGRFYQWTEFAGVYRSPVGVNLQRIRRGPSVRVWLTGSRGDDEFVHLLRTLVRDSYKGKLTTLPASPVAERPATEPPELSNIAAYKQNL